MSSKTIVDVLAGMEIKPRERRWSSLSYCVIDAVWSISARYHAVVAPLVCRVAAANADDHPVIDASTPLPPDPLPLPALIQPYPDGAALRAVTNSQRTSTRCGIEKAEAVLRYAHIPTNHRAVDLTDVADLMGRPTVLGRLQPGPGHGSRRASTRRRVEHLLGTLDGVIIVADALHAQTAHAREVATRGAELVVGWPPKPPLGPGLLRSRLTTL